MGEELNAPQPARAWNGSVSSPEGPISCRLNGSVPDQLSQLWNELSFCQPVFEVFPEGNAEFAACLLQTGESVSTSSTGFASCSSAYLASFHILSDAILAQIVMQWDFRVSEHQQKLGLVVVDSLKGMIE